MLFISHSLSNVLLDISPSPISCSPRCLLIKAYQYLSRTLPFNTIHDWLHNQTPTVLAQTSIYTRDTTICSIQTNIFPPCVNYILSSGAYFQQSEQTKGHPSIPRVTQLHLPPLNSSPQLHPTFCILFSLLHQNTPTLSWKIIMNTSRPNSRTQYHNII